MSNSLIKPLGLINNNETRESYSILCFIAQIQIWSFCLLKLHIQSSKYEMQLNAEDSLQRYSFTRKSKNKSKKSIKLFRLIKLLSCLKSGCISVLENPSIDCMWTRITINLKVAYSCWCLRSKCLFENECSWPPYWS